MSILKSNLWGMIIVISYISPNDPAVKPIIKKNENSAKSLGKLLTKIFN